MHNALSHLLFNTYDYRDNRGVIMMITVITFFIIAQHYRGGRLKSSFVLSTHLSDSCTQVACSACILSIYL